MKSRARIAFELGYFGEIEARVFFEKGERLAILSLDIVEMLFKFLFRGIGDEGESHMKGCDNHVGSEYHTPNVSLVLANVLREK